MMQMKQRKILMQLKLKEVGFFAHRIVFSLLKCFYTGGDLPEAIAPALEAAVNTLRWRPNAVKIAVLIADAPPHGLSVSCGDHWPNGRNKSS